jgi:hypothetical protein
VAPDPVRPGAEALVDFRPHSSSAAPERFRVDAVHQRPVFEKSRDGDSGTATLARVWKDLGALRVLVGRADDTDREVSPFNGANTTEDRLPRSAHPPDRINPGGMRHGVPRGGEVGIRSPLAGLGDGSNTASAGHDPGCDISRAWPRRERHSPRKRNALLAARAAQGRGPERPGRMVGTRPETSQAPPRVTGRLKWGHRPPPLLPWSPWVAPGASSPSLIGSRATRSPFEPVPR